MSFKPSLLVLLSMTSLLVACGPDCVSMCEKAQEDGDCFKDSDGLGDRNCESYCEDIEEIVAEDRGDCEEDLDELLSCMDDEDDACEAYLDDCDDERNEVTECITEYCIEHLTNDACEDL